MAWRLTIRSGPTVDRESYEVLEDALAALERRCREIEVKPPRRMVRVPTRTFSPAEQVAARAELAGPRRMFPSVRAGVDVRGDGTTEPWIGRTTREIVPLESDEDAYAALRRALTSTESSVSVEP